jgi:hypothetical protein
MHGLWEADSADCAGGTVDAFLWEVSKAGQSSKQITK